MTINTTLAMYIILLLILLVIIYYLFNKYQEGFKYKINNPKCDSHNCPISKYQNDIYKLHIEFNPIRDNNHMITNNSVSNYWFNQIKTKTKGPNNIFIIRHGEKVKSKFALDCNGILRSTFIPQLVETLNTQGFGIHGIITTNDYEYMHQQQTVLLTSWLFNIPTFIYGEDNETEKAVKQVFSNPFFDGKNVLFCWEHTCIQTLLVNIMKAGNKKIDKSKIPYWTTNNYKSILHLDNNMNLNILEENFTTCYPQDNNLLKYGKKQKCK